MYTSAGIVEAVKNLITGSYLGLGTGTYDSSTEVSGSGTNYQRVKCNWYTGGTPSTDREAFIGIDGSVTEIENGFSVTLKNAATFFFDDADNGSTIPPVSPLWGDISVIYLYSAISGGNKLYEGQLIDPSTQQPTTKTITQGDRPRFVTGAISITINFVEAAHNDE